MVKGIWSCCGKGGGAPCGGPEKNLLGTFFEPSSDCDDNDAEVKDDDKDGWLLWFKTSLGEGGGAWLGDLGEGGTFTWLALGVVEEEEEEDFIRGRLVVIEGFKERGEGFKEEEEEEEAALFMNFPPSSSEGRSIVSRFEVSLMLLLLLLLLLLMMMLLFEVNVEEEEEEEEEEEGSLLLSDWLRLLIEFFLLNVRALGTIDWGEGPLVVSLPVAEFELLDAETEKEGWFAETDDDPLGIEALFFRPTEGDRWLEEDGAERP
jgi:hypothetical protein